MLPVSIEEIRAACTVIQAAVYNALKDVLIAMNVLLLLTIQSDDLGITGRTMGTTTQEAVASLEITVRIGQ